jgi:large subunit ribosomal protein L28
MSTCAICNKKRTFGHNVSHAKNRTNRDWKPNIQRTKVNVSGTVQTINMCTRCRRTMYKSRYWQRSPVRIAVKNLMVLDRNAL